METQATGESQNLPDEIFEDVLNLEDQYFTEGYNLGVADGSRAGQIEGRIFGLQKGFEKFAEIGRLGGQSAVWDARLQIPGTKGTLASLTGTERLKKHVQRLQTLTDRDTLPTENDEDAVSEFDDRLKDAKAKATLISKIVGEDDISPSSMTADQPHSSRTTLRPLRVRKGEAGKPTGEMEDFSGLAAGKKTSRVDG